MTGDVTSAAGIAVLEPSPAHLLVLLVYLGLIVGDVESQSTKKVDAADTGADANDPDGLRSAEGLIPDDIHRVRPVTVCVCVTVHSGIVKLF